MREVRSVISLTVMKFMKKACEVRGAVLKLTQTKTNSRNQPMQLMLYPYAIKNQRKRSSDKRG